MHLAAVIALFHTRIASARQPPTLVPSGDRNVLENLIGMHPINLASPHVPGINQGCSICLDPFIDQQTIMTTVCKHHFHVVCIMRFWDQDGCYVYECPNCRGRPAMMHERVGIHPQALNVWNWTPDPHQTEPTRHNVPFSDLNSVYASSEAIKRSLSLWWDEVNPGEPRDVMVEMARARALRRLCDHQIRTGVWQRRTGIEFLDGRVAPPGATDEELAEQRAAFREETQMWSLADLQEALLEQGIGDADGDANSDSDESNQGTSADGVNGAVQAAMGVVGTVWGFVFGSGSGN